MYFSRYLYIMNLTNIIFFIYPLSPIIGVSVMVFYACPTYVQKCFATVMQWLKMWNVLHKKVVVHQQYSNVFDNYTTKCFKFQNLILLQIKNDDNLIKLQQMCILVIWYFKYNKVLLYHYEKWGVKWKEKNFTELFRNINVVCMILRTYLICF